MNGDAVHLLQDLVLNLLHVGLALAHIDAHDGLVINNAHLQQQQEQTQQDEGYAGASALTLYRAVPREPGWFALQAPVCCPQGAHTATGYVGRL